MGAAIDDPLTVIAKEFGSSLPRVKSARVSSATSESESDWFTGQLGLIQIVSGVYVCW